MSQPQLRELAKRRLQDIASVSGLTPEELGAAKLVVRDLIKTESFALQALIVALETAIRGQRAEPLLEAMGWKMRSEQIRVDRLTAYVANTGARRVKMTGGAR